MNDFGDFDDDFSDDFNDDFGDDGDDFMDDDSIEDAFDDDFGPENSLEDEPTEDDICEDDITVEDAVFIGGTMMGWGYEEGLEEAERRKLEKKMNDKSDKKDDG